VRENPAGIANSDMRESAREAVFSFLSWNARPWTLRKPHEAFAPRERRRVKSCAKTSWSDSTPPGKNTPCALQNKAKFVYNIYMSRFCLAALAALLVLSCESAIEAERVPVDLPVVPAAGIETSFTPPAPPPGQSVSPMAVLQAGEFPLWFQFATEGPRRIETIEAASYSAALIPWPHAQHVRFVLAQDDELLLAVNHDGFIRLAPWQGSNDGVAMYRFAGGEFWQQYTVGAFVRPDPGASPVALLYRNDWFLLQDLQPPSPRLWTFDERSAAPRAISLPSLDAFAPEEGWDMNALSQCGDGNWYFRAGRRAIGKGVVMQEVHMLRTDSLEREGVRVTHSEFQAAARPERLDAAPPALREMLAAVFAESGAGLASVVSPEFQTMRYFSEGGSLVHAFYSPNPFLLAATPAGDAVYVRGSSLAGVQQTIRFSLPVLPEGFVYTGIGMVADTVFATWEEQAGFSIGAAGFVAIRPTELNGLEDFGALPDADK